MATKDTKKADKTPDDPVVFTFTPAVKGHYINGIPQRDLTAADIAALSPLELHNATAPGPTGTPMYTAVDAPAGGKDSGGDA